MHANVVTIQSKPLRIRVALSHQRIRLPAIITGDTLYNANYVMALFCASRVKLVYILLNSQEARFSTNAITKMIKDLQFNK